MEEVPERVMTWVRRSGKGKAVADVDGGSWEERRWGQEIVALRLLRRKAMGGKGECGGTPVG